MKRIFVLLLIFLLLPYSAVMADNTEKDFSGSGSEQEAFFKGEYAELGLIIADAEYEVTGQFIVFVTQPQCDLTVYENIYTVYGYAIEPDVNLVLAVYNKKTDKYEMVCYDEKEFVYNIGHYGIYSQKLGLEEGENRIKLVAWRDDAKDKTLRDESLQVTYFSITCREALKDKIKNSINILNDLFRSLFKDINTR